MKGRKRIWPVLLSLILTITFLPAFAPEAFGASYTATFDAGQNGHFERTGNPRKVSLRTGSNGRVNAPDDDPVYKDYHHIFYGWEDASGEEVDLYEEAYYITGDTTFCAIWEEAYQLTFDANGGYFEDGSAVMYFACEKEDTADYICEEPEIDDENKIFAGWKLANGEPVELEDYVPTKDTVFYAAWTEENDDISFTAPDYGFFSDDKKYQVEVTLETENPTPYALSVELAAGDEDESGGTYEVLDDPEGTPYFTVNRKKADTWVVTLNGPAIREGLEGESCDSLMLTATAKLGGRRTCVRDYSLKFEEPGTDYETFFLANIAEELCAGASQYLDPGQKAIYYGASSPEGKEISCTITGISSNNESVIRAYKDGVNFIIKAEAAGTANVTVNYRDDSTGKTGSGTRTIKVSKDVYSLWLETDAKDGCNACPGKKITITANGSRETTTGYSSKGLTYRWIMNSPYASLKPVTTADGQPGKAYFTIDPKLDFSNGVPDCIEIKVEMLEGGVVRKTESVWINPMEPKAVTPKVTVSALTYNGSVQKPAVRVYDGNTLIPASEYDVSCPNSVNAGSYTLRVTLKGDYSGSKAVNYSIAPRNIIPAVILSNSMFNWNNRVQTPGVTVKDGGAVLPASQYTVSYANGRRNIGMYSVRVTLQGNYRGTGVATYTIGPKATRLSSVKAAKRAAKVKWAKQTGKMPKKTINGYQIQCSLRKDFKSGNRIVNVAGCKKNSRKISGLKSKKIYYFRVRTYMKSGGKTYYSGWSGVRSARIK